MFFSTGKHHLAHHLLAIDDIDTWTKEAEISTEIASIDAVDTIVIIAVVVNTDATDGGC